MTEQWTANEERQFHEMSERRVRVLAKRREPVAALAADLHKVDWQFPSNITEWLIANADEVRDVLAPYDSGVRAVEIGAKE
jgi:hypothetical protein